jgi:Flp pilus assembly protein TadG
MRRFGPDARAGTAIVFALCLPIILGFLGLGSEVGYWYYEGRKLQSAADIAAFQAAVSLQNGNTKDQATTAARTGAMANGWSSTSGTITFNNPPTSGSNKNTNSVEVVLTLKLPRYFTALFSNTGYVPITARAVATKGVSGSACILALNPTATQEINVSGSGNINSPNCDVVADSTASNAFRMTGSAQITAPCIVTPGDVSVTSGLHLNKCTAATVHAAAVPDPYASVPAPTPTGPCITVPNNAATLSPGYYCHGLATSWTVTFQPGVYYVAGGGLNMSAGTHATGSGVTFYVVAGNQTAVSGSATATLSAPTSGTYSGIVFFGDRSATSGNNAFSGGTSTLITGAVYYPTQNVTYSGGTSTANACTQLVVGTLTVSGGAYFNNNCTNTGMANIGVDETGSGTGKTRLVE